MGFVPFVASEGIAFPADISLDLTPKFIWNPTPRPLHGSEKGKMEKVSQVHFNVLYMLRVKGISVEHSYLKQLYFILYIIKLI